MSFTWYPGLSNGGNAQPAIPTIQNSVSFIIRDIISATTLNNGLLNLSPRYNNGINGNVLGSGSPTLYYPLNSQNADTLACLNCLTASTSTPCTVSLSNGGTNQNPNGRGFTVRLYYI